MPYIPAGRRGVAVLAACVTALSIPSVASAASHGSSSNFGSSSRSSSQQTSSSRQSSGSQQTSSSRQSSGSQQGSLPIQALQSYLASTNISTSSCAQPLLSQAFMALAGDTAEYSLVPGESAGNFTGTNWFMWNGANVESTTLANGKTGNVLDLPRGGVALSPPMCVASDYPYARAMVKSLAGNDSAQVFVVYQNGSSYQLVNGGSATGKGTAWGLSGLISLQPASGSGWQIARFAVFAPSSEMQLYNLYVDPYAKG
jgi:hypothetical protein